MKRDKIKVIKIIGIILISLLLIFVLENKVFADPTGIEETNPILNPDYYKPDSSIDAKDADKLQAIGNTIVGVIQVIGTILSVAVLAVMGIKYMVGSVEERAEYKKTMIPYLIGAIMIFSITNLLGIVVKIIQALGLTI